jgi:two-component system OmpR family response regulator
LMYRIFIIDDDRRFVGALTDLFGTLTGIEVVGHAEDEDTAVEWLIDNPTGWDMAVVDLALGSGSGLRVLSACRVRQSTQKIAVLSGHLNSAMRRRCEVLGANAVFAKDGDIESILQYCHSASKARS